MSRKLGDILVGWGAISPAELQHCLAMQAQEPPRRRRRLGRILLDEERVTEITLARALAESHGLQAVDLSQEEIDPDLARSIPQLVAKRALVLPLQIQDGTLRIAAADPVDVVGLDDVRLHVLRKHKGVRVQVVVAPESQLRRRLASTWSEANAVEALEGFDDAAVTTVVEEEASGSDEGAVSAVHQIMAMAIRLGASDIHVEPLASEVRVRMRVDGTLRKVMVLPKSGQAPLTSRIKIIANIDIAQRRVPQDGRARISLDGVSRNIRVSTLPTLHGEKVVIRLLTDIGELPALSALGIPPEGLSIIHEALRSSQGLVLITGPTGSGKTTTLYSAIHEIVTGERNLITLEEPVEIELPGVSQVQIDEKVGMTFAAGLRSVLRQDPDIIMVGEIRDKVTADLAIRAALTGHLVLATVHTIDAPSAVIRLVDMGVPRYLIASSLNLVIAQRLVRRPCQYCIQPQVPDPETRQRLQLSQEQSLAMVVGRGCEKCEAHGYRGRTGVFEVLPVTKDVRAALMSGGDEATLAAAARASGWKPLIESGVDVAVRRQTTAAELLRVLLAGTL
ncbi:MAG: Flp pilus assembly complex ATPase component TadA [Actinobacteria bacterium]|nr:Flp pilus assembly complex ATPase component TadA [Actinomycetota bacterium]